KAAAGGQGKVTLSLADQPNPDPLGVTISEWVVSYGGNPLILNDSGSVQAFTFLQGLWKEGVFAKESLQAKYDTEVNYLRGETSWPRSRGTRSRRSTPSPRPWPTAGTGQTSCTGPTSRPRWTRPSSRSSSGGRTRRPS